MNRHINILGFVLLLFSQTQAQEWEWAKNFDFEFTETQSTIGGVDNEGNIYLTLMNISDITHVPGNAYRLLKLDPDGQMIWAKDISQYFQGRITTDLIGNNYITYSGKLACIDKDGNEIWNVNDPIVKTFWKTKIRNGMLIVDGSEYMGNDSTTLFTASYSTQGVIKNRVYFNINKFAKTAWDPDLNVWAIHGWYPDPITSNTGKLLMYDSTGAFLFSREIPYPDGISTDNEGNAYVFGGFRGPIELDGKNFSVPTGLITTYQFLAKYSPTGQLLWYKIIEGGSFGSARITSDEFGNIYYAVAYSQRIKIGTDLEEVSNDNGSFIVLKWDSNGNLKGKLNTNGNYTTASGGHLDPQSLIYSHGDLFVSGWMVGDMQFGNTFVQTNSPDYSQLFVGKISQKNMVGIHEESSKQDLWQIFPNPSGDVFCILGNSEEVMTISVRDARGQVVRTETLQGNNKHVDLSAFSPGVYLLQIRSGSRTETKKLMKN